MATTYSITWPAVVDQGTGPGVPAAFTLTLDSASVSSSAFSVTDGGFGGTFLPSASPSIPAGQLSATFTYKPSASTVDRSISITVTNFAALAQPTPASRTFTVTNFGYHRTAWVANMKAAPILSDWASFASPAPIQSPQSTLHYDPTEVFEAFRRYTGDTATFDPLIAIVNYQWRDGFVLPNGGIANDYQNWSRGLRDTWVRAGDETSRGAAVLLSVNGLYTSDQTTLSSAYSDQSASRPVSQSIGCYLDAEDCGCAGRSKLDGAAGNNFVNYALGNCLQWLTPEASWPICRFLQPFMVGLTLRALIAYWDRYRDARNANFPNLGAAIPGGGGATLGATIPAVVKQMLDLLWTGSNRGIPYWFPDQYHPTVGVPAFPTTPHPPWGDGAGYPVGPAGTGAFGYFYPDTGTGSNALPISMDQSCTGVRAAGGGSPVPSAYENGYLSPAYYWYWWYTSAVLGAPDDNYRRRGDAVFAGSASSVPNIFVSGYIKSFNQAYFWTVEGVGWRDRMVVPPPVTTAVALAGPASGGGAANAPSGPFAVSLSPAGSATINPVVVTPVVPGGRAIPARLTLTTDRPVQAFRAVPGAGSAGTTIPVSVTFTSTAPDFVPSAPAPAGYAVGPAAPVATGYTLAAPATPVVVGPHLYTDPFTVGISPAGSAPGPAADATGGLVMIGIGDFGVGGAFLPKATWIGPARPTATFAYKPQGTATRSVAATNALGLPSSPASAPVNPTAADYTLAAPSPATGPVGSPSAPLVVALAPGNIQVNTLLNIPGTIPVTLSDGAGGGFSTATFSLSNAARSVSPTYTPATPGTRTITATAGADVLTAPGTFNPPSVSYVVASATSPGYLTMAAGGGYLAIQIN